MDLFLHQALAGLATGSIYACLALAIVMIYAAINHLNFAQGEMAMFSTFIAWQLMQWGAPYLLAFVGAAAFSFVAGIAVERVLFRPIHKAPVLSHIVLFIALFAILNSLAGFIWDYNVKSFPTPFGSRSLFGNGLVSSHDAGMMGVAFTMLVLLYVFFRHTRIGLAMRAAAANPESARLAGVRVGRMISLGWGMAAAIGAVAGIMIAPVVFLDPNMMTSILVYGFAGAVVGGLTSPGGAVFGGLAVGIIENLAGTYIPYVGRELRLTIALFIIVAVLTAKPSGLFGRAIVTRV
ncbi:MAG TPA: branched-chain amino acid ABC transporter permease [Xanthobacteraceae bacterium]|jgi:branched-chain amino acid transport system permease protein|nr:branched-chain amino acid ABC transporter permease [Xanthobacteraceae bacterium]